ncbi:MAG TPA: hypothetical protein VGM50_14130 [Gemmatimonadaceae bacterium]|jgi:hypothetical protein
MKNLYGYLLTGWMFAALSAWYSRDTQSAYSILTRLAIAVAWIVAWPLALIIVFISTLIRKRL